MNCCNLFSETPLLNLWNFYLTQCPSYLQHLDNHRLKLDPRGSAALIIDNSTQWTRTFKQIHSIAQRFQFKICSDPHNLQGTSILIYAENHQIMQLWTYVWCKILFRTNEELKLQISMNFKTSENGPIVIVKIDTEGLQNLGFRFKEIKSTFFDSRESQLMKRGRSKATVVANQL
ncbi:Hypothetical_protein [Hexamita inflata]|uniref:Hypothetical_protein n=1 Tax=Hexamita inflata TaxID=28002 RepID=A0AA86URY2_9EUKA|nr:Hypothetical protein HINF_LOCUS56970 [Hexamita inflata]